MKKCTTKLLNEANNQIKDNKMQMLEKEVEKLNKQVSIYESLLKSAMAPQTVTNFNFISNAYPNTPALEGQKTYINMCEAKTMSLVELIYLYYHDNKLVIFIGDYIIKLYKKEEPKDQAMWPAACRYRSLSLRTYQD